MAAGGLGASSWSDLELAALTDWPGVATDAVAALLKNSRQGRPFSAASWGTASCVMQSSKSERDTLVRGCVRLL